MMTLALALLLPLAAPLAEDPAFLEGQRLYQESEYEQAVFRLQAAALVTDRPAAEQAQVLLWLGLAYAGFGDLDSARRAFKDALRLDSEVALPVEVSPKIEAELEAVRAEHRAAPPVAPPPPPPAAPPAANAEGPWVLAGGLGALGLMCVTGGAIATGFAVASKAVIDDRESFQDDALRAQEDRDVQVAAAIALFGAGAMLLGGSGAVVALDLAE